MYNFVHFEILIFVHFKFIIYTTADNLKGVILQLFATVAQFAVFCGWGSVMPLRFQSRHTGANRWQRRRDCCPLTVLTAKTASFGGLVLPSYRHCRHSREKILCVRRCGFQNSEYRILQDVPCA